jgi:L-iditol 2-dehydrogenase
MNAEALVCETDQHVELVDVDLPDLGPRDVVVDTQYSGLSNGTERNLIRGDVSWGPFPLCTGYQAVGIVDAVGRDVTELELGDRVYYRENQIECTRDGRRVSPVRGAHCSTAVVDVDDSVIGQLPDDASTVPASLFALASIALNGVRMADVQPSDDVVVQGVGLVGLGVVAWAAERGATVIAVDPIVERLSVAQSLGATEVISPQGTDVETRVSRNTSGGADVVFEAAGRESLVDAGLALCATDGRFVFMSDYGDADVTFGFRTAHTKELTALFPCGDGGADCRRRALDGIATEDIHWKQVIETVLTPADAPAFYDRLLDGDARVGLGATVRWSDP